MFTLFTDGRAYYSGLTFRSFDGCVAGDTPRRHFPGRILPLRWQKTTLDVEGNSPKNRLVQKCCVRTRQCSHVNESRLRSRTSSTISRYRAAHRSRRIQTNHNRSRQLRYVSTSDLGCLMQCSADILRNFQVRIQVRSKVLVRELFPRRISDSSAIRSAT